MKRRTLLAGVATGAVGLSGCLAEGNGGDGDDSENTDGSEDGGNDGDGGDTNTGGSNPPSIEDSTIRTTAKNCGSTDAGEATAKRENGEITVEGLTTASNPCHEAILDSVEIQNRQLVVRVDVERTDQVCQQCIGEIEYRATVTVSNAGALHGTTVEHVDGEEYVTNWEESEDGSP
jgi:hypothetical protein